MNGSTPEYGAPSVELTGAAPAARSHRERWAALVLGLNAWGVALVWPLLLADEGAPQPLWPTAAALAPLLLGIGLQPYLERGDGWLRSLPAALLLSVFPAALALVFASRSEALLQHALPPMALVLSWAALCAYGASAVAVCREPASELPARSGELQASPWDAEVPERSRLQPFAIALCAAGATAIALLAPSLGGFRELSVAWGESARAGGVLTAVVGVALGAAVLAVFLGSALRAEPASRQSAPPGEVPLRVSWFLFLALLSFVTYFIVQP